MGRRSGHHMPSYGGVSVELRPHRQRETVPIGLVELSPYRVSLISVGWRRAAHMNRRERIQLIGVLTRSVSSTRTSPKFMFSTIYQFGTYWPPSNPAGIRSAHNAMAVPSSRTLGEANTNSGLRD